MNESERRINDTIYNSQAALKSLPSIREIPFLRISSTIRNVEVFAGKGVRNKLNPKVAKGLSEQIGGRPRDWKHLKGIGTLDYKGHARDAEVHWFEAAGQPKVKFKIQEWL